MTHDTTETSAAARSEVVWVILLACILGVCAAIPVYWIGLSKSRK